MRRKKRNVLAVMIAVLMMSGVVSSMSKQVQAASATIKLAAMSENIQEGDIFSVTVTITSTATIGEVSQQIKYDKEMLQFQEETSGYKEKDGVITITDSDPSEKNQKYLFQFKALKQGESRVTIAGTPEIYASNGSILSLSKNVLSVMVGPKKEKSANRNLAMLTVKEGSLNKAFKNIETEYEVSVAQDVKAITITAKPEHKGAKVEVTGADKLLVGKNTVVIKVTSETNKTKEYMLYVTRGMGDSQMPSPTPEQGSGDAVIPEKNPSSTENLQLQQETDAKLVEEDGRLLLHGQEEYELLTLQNLRELPKGYFSVALAIDNHAVDAYQLENGVDKDLYLLYAKHEEESPCFYQYDAKEGTLQRYVEERSNEEPFEEAITIGEYNKKVRELGSIIGVAAGLLVLSAMIGYHFYKKSRE